MICSRGPEWRRSKFSQMRLDCETEMTARDYRSKLKDGVLEALRALGGSAQIVPICKYIWEQHEQELRASGDFFYIWQYEMRWAGQKLQQEGKLKKHRSGRKWQLLR